MPTAYLINLIVEGAPRPRLTRSLPREFIVLSELHRARSSSSLSPSNSGGPRAGPRPRTLLRRHRRNLLARRRKNGLHDVMIPGAAANIALKVIAHLLLARLGVLLQKRRRRHHHARRAEPALKPVMLLKRRLNHTQRPIRPRLTLNRRNSAALRLSREHRARLHRNAVNMNNTGSALRGVTPNMRPRHPQTVTQKSRQQRPTLNSPRYQTTVQFKRYFHNKQSSLYRRRFSSQSF